MTRDVKSPDHLGNHGSVRSAYAPSVRWVQLSVRQLLALVMAISAMLAVWRCVVYPVKEAQMAYQCTFQLRRIGAAMQAYRDAHGAYPPSIIVNGDGGPMHSWRAAILPYLVDPRLAASYDWASSWNSDRNMRAARNPRLAELFRCPAAGDTNCTSYLMLTTKGRKRDASPLFLIEVDDARLIWSAPIDLTTANDTPSNFSILPLCAGKVTWVRSTNDNGEQRRN